MEKRKLYTTTLSFGISALILILSHNANAFKYLSSGIDAGLSGSFLYTDLDGSKIGGGSGYQISAYSIFDIKKDYLLKIQWDSVTLRQDPFNDTTISNNLHLQQVEQRFNLFLIGVEKRFETWFWEAFTGYSFGKNSAYLVKNSSTNQSSSLEQRTKSFLLIGGAIGYRMPYKNIHWIARLKTFSLLSNVYKDGLGNESFYFVLPLLMNLGLEF